jgi:cytochrome bd-type quinol oxidase subunit 2
MTSQGPLGGVQDYLGVGELWFEMDQPEKRRFRAACVLPFLAAAALLATFLIDVFREPDYETYDFWDRLYSFASTVQVPFTYVGVAGLVVLGIGRVTRGQASWALAVALLLILSGITAGMYASLLPFVLSATADATDYHIGTAITLSWQSGILAMGFAFLAFRGLRDSEHEWEDDEPMEAE